MGTVYRDISIARDAGEVWDAVRDIGNAHTRLFPGVLSDVELVHDGRVVTFANGAVVREPTLGICEDNRRYAWTTEGGIAKHFNASLQVFEDGEGRCRVVWITDLLANEGRETVEALVDAGILAMKATLEG